MKPRPALQAPSRSLVVGTVLALAATLLAAAPGSAQRDGDHFPVAVKGTVPAGGNLSASTPTLPRRWRGVLDTTVVVTKGSTDDEKRSFRSLTHILAAKKTKGEKLLTCIRMHQTALSDWSSSEGKVVIKQDDSESLALLFLAACIEAAGLLAPPPARAIVPRAGPHKCARKMDDLPFKLRTSDGERKLVVRLQPEKTENPLLKVTCTATKRKVSYGVKAAGKRTLNRVVGNRLSVGVKSPADAVTGVPLKLTFDTR